MTLIVKQTNVATNQITIVGEVNDRKEAISCIEAIQKNYDHGKYHPEQDYWWARNNGDDASYVKFVIEGSPKAT